MCTATEMILSSEILTSYDACERRGLWMRLYDRFRVPPLAALYRALDAGLTGEKPEQAGHTIMTIAAQEGLDVTERAVYEIAVHYAHLANILATFLRGQGPAWIRVKDVPLGGHLWHSACYEAGERIRRIALVDYWSDDRRDQELRGWRSQAEMAALGRPLILNALSIGQTQAGRRVSHWARSWAHPQNKRIRFKRTTGTTEGFAATWNKIWRENSDLTTEQWLDQMQRDRALDEVVHTVLAEVPARAQEVRQDMLRIAREMTDQKPLPPMRRAGCYGFSPCPFLGVCYGNQKPVPSLYGYRRKSGPEPGPEPNNLCQNSAKSGSENPTLVSIKN